MSVCVLLGSVSSTENTYKYHMQVQPENAASDCSLQQPHKTTLPLKQLLKPRAGHRVSEADSSMEQDAAQGSDVTSSDRCIESVIVTIESSGQ